MSIHAHSLPPPRPPQARARRTTRGFGMVEVLIASIVIGLATLAGVSFVARSAQQTDLTCERLFAYQKAVSILAELRGYVTGGEGEVASDLDQFDDGDDTSPTLTITTWPENPDELVPADHPVSGNTEDLGVWRWQRKISVRTLRDLDARDRRFCTVQIYRQRPQEEAPGTMLAQVSGVVQSVSDVSPPAQIYDVYALAINTCPGWWVEPGSVQAYLESALSELEVRLPGVQFRLHLIRSLGYGRDEEYAPYVNEERTTTDPTSWTYWYPGRLPDDVELEREDEHYYEASIFRGRVNVDGDPTPVFVNDYALPEPFEDLDHSRDWDDEEPFTDLNDNEAHDAGNTVPYAIADQHNHLMRWPEEKARFDARVAAGLDKADAPTWRLLLDDMIANPSRYHNAMFVNLHGELLPMPPARNYSDAAKDPTAAPGWRAVAHPELLRPTRVAGNDLLSRAPTWRVYAYKTRFPDAATHMTLREPLRDANNDGIWSTGETFTDWNGNAKWDDAMPISLVVPGCDLSKAPNAAVAPSLLIKSLPGGIDSDANAVVEDYTDWANAVRLPETFTDSNNDGRHQRAEPYLDLNGNGVRESPEPWQELNGDTAFTAVGETLVDQNGNARWDEAAPEEPYTDGNANGQRDAPEPWWDKDGNGVWTAPTAPKTPWVAITPVEYANPTQLNNYIKFYGEPFLDLDGNKLRQLGEAFTDMDGDGRYDGGYRRGAMWYSIRYEAAANRTVLELHGTPLETPQTLSKRGLKSDMRLYDLDYVPAPTPSTAIGVDRFERDLFEIGDFPKNTARWRITLPLASLRRAFETSAGANNGDQQDRLIPLETRLGRDLTTGVRTPIWNKPSNRSVTYAYFYGDPAKIPFSERYQFQGDPRHSPYADLDATGTTFSNGYNWYFDSLKTDGDAQALWLGLSPTRLHARWMDRCALDVPRYMQWLRTALLQTESLYTNMTGFTAYYMSVGGDVGYDSENTTFEVPISGLPLGQSALKYGENTFMDVNGFSETGCTKFVRSNAGEDKGIREAGYWWSKPWLGELCPDDSYTTYWRPFGNLRAGLTTDTGSPATYRLMRREKITKEQQPEGTVMKDARGMLGAEGCPALFMAGSAGSARSVRHKEGSIAGFVVEQGIEIGQHYDLAMPVAVTIKHPFQIDIDKDGEKLPEADWPTDFPRTTASYGAKFFAKATGAAEHGSAMVRLLSSDGTHMARFAVTSILPDTEGGPAFMSRYQLTSLLHSFMAEGRVGTPRRIAQLPRITIQSPTALTELKDPGSISVTWRVRWLRWDGRPYTEAYPANFAESEAKLVYVGLYSTDNGETWHYMRGDAIATPGVLPTVGGVVDASKVLYDQLEGADEAFNWSTPASKIGEGSTLIRIEAYRTDEPLHYAQHTEHLYVDR